ncbi:hypothetical protein BLNAU_12760 [Blattamonas nauphoetae]|uniref:Uncharacterized protein n=1 Tax=Blattamonas nauphoetae TaxID=2049346 RepID=A0ABQ9XMB8_9EUKA|nr:hypothetical protein BLNAU_12760 [Blattamonas nauphoetae]
MQLQELKMCKITNIPHHSVVNVVPSLSSLTNMSYSHPVDTGSPSATGSTQVGSGLRSSGTPAYLNRFTKNQKQKHAMSLLASLWQRNVTPITNSDLFDLEGDVEETEVRNLFTKFVNVRGKASDDDDSKFSTKDAKDKRKKIKRPLAEEWWYSTIERGNLVRKDENTTGTDPISPSYSEFSTLLSQTTAQGTFRIPYPTYEDALRVISLLSSEMSEGLLFSEERNFPSVATHNPIPTDDTKDEDPLEETSNDFESFLTIANSVNSRHDHSNVQNIAKKDAVKAMRFAMALNRQDDPKVSTPIQSDIKLAPLILPAELQAPVKEPEIEHVEPEPQPLPAPIESDMIYKSHVLRRLNEIELTPLNPLPLVGNLISTRSIDQTENEGTSRTTTPTLTEISEGHTPEHLESTILRQNTLRKRQGQMTSVNAQRFEDKSSRTDTPDQMSGRTSQTRARRRREPRDGARVWITDFEKEFSDHEDDPQNAAFKKSIRATNRRRMDGTTIDFEKRPMDLFPSVSTYFDPALHPKIAPFTHPNTEQILAFRAKLVPKSPESTPSPPPQADPIPIFNLEQQIEEEWKKANADFFTDIRAYFLRRVLLRFFDNKYKIDEDEELDLLTMSIEEQVDHILTSPQTHSLRAVFDQIPFPTLLFLSVLPKQPFSCQLWENELFRAQESAFPSTPSQHSQSLLLVPSHLPPLPQDTLNTSFASTQTQQLTSTFPLPKFESLPLSLPSLLVKSQKLNSDPHTPHSSTSDTSSLVDPHSQSSLLSPESLTLSTTSHTFSKTTDSIPVPLPVGPFPDLEPAKLPLPTFDVFEVLSKMNSIVLTLNGQWETTRKRFKTESFKLHTSPNFEPITPEPRIPLLPPVQTESSLLTDVTPIVPPIDSSMLAHQNEDFNMLWVDNLPEESKPYQFLISTLKMNGIDPIPFFSDLLTKDIQLEQAKLQNEAFISPLTSGEPIHAFNSPNPFTVSQPPSPAFGSSYSTPPSTPSAGPIAFLNSVFDTTTPSMLARPVSNAEHTANTDEPSILPFLTSVKLKDFNWIASNIAVGERVPSSFKHRVLVSIRQSCASAEDGKSVHISLVDPLSSCSIKRVLNTPKISQFEPLEFIHHNTIHTASPKSTSNSLYTHSKPNTENVNKTLNCTDLAKFCGVVVIPTLRSSNHSKQRSDSRFLCCLFASDTSSIPTTTCHPHNTCQDVPQSLPHTSSNTKQPTITNLASH